MAYLVFSSQKGQEIGRRRLDGPVTIGRSPDCDVSLHDILLSRRHCRLERTRQGWVITDLHSKNGTVIDGRLVDRHVLRPGEVVKIGRVNVTFRAGKLAREEERTQRLTRPQRPAAPSDASSGTVAGFRYEPPAGERSVEKFPTPKPVLTDSGKFVLDDSQLGSAAIEAGSRAARAGVGLAATTVATRAPVPRSARPKTPTGDAGDAAPVVAPQTTLPEPPRPPAGLRLRAFIRALQRGVRRPLSKWAALLSL